MKTASHTSGDWYVERIPKMMDKRPDEWDTWAVYSTRKTRLWDKPQPICNFNWGIPEGKANANLISACPDMFNALQAICDAFGDQDSLLIDQAKAALSKAKGELK